MKPADWNAYAAQSGTPFSVVSRGDFIVAVSMLFLTRIVALASFPVFDDAFITFRYGRNLAAGKGFIYNIGDTVLGTTSPLFGLFTALLARLGVAPEVFVPLFNIAVDAGIVVLVGRCFLSGNRTAFIFFWVLFCLSPMLARTTVGGMEVDVFTLATLGSFALYQSDHKKTAGFLAAVSYFLRPEGVLTVAILCVCELIRTRRIAPALRIAAIALATVVPALILMQLLYGSFLPQSILAKSHHIAVPPLNVLIALLAPEPLSAAIACIGILSIPFVVRQNSLMAAWLATYLAAYALGGPKVWSWYSFAPLTMCAVLAAMGLATALSRLRVPYASKMGAPALALVVLVEWVGIGFARYPDRITANIYEPVKNFCASSVKPTDTILASDIGVVGYYCPAFIYDAAGLVWRPALQLRGNIRAIAAKFRPTYLFLNVDRSLIEQVAAPETPRQYKPVARFAEDGNRDPTKVKNDGDHWSQEYILFKRAGADENGR